MRVVTNGIRADPRLRCGDLFGSVRGVCLFDPAIPWNIVCLFVWFRKGRLFVCFLGPKKVRVITPSLTAKEYKSQLTSPKIR